MTTAAALREQFLALHRPGAPLLLPNAFSAGTARVMASLGFAAVATTSGGHALQLGRHDGSVTRDEALAHAAELVAATDLPTTADLENGFGADPAGVAETVRLAAAAGLAGCSIEDASRDRDDPILPRAEAVDRVAAAAEEARRSPLVLCARAENHLYGRGDLGDTITRLQAFQDAGADVLYAPGLARAEDVRAVIAAVDRPVNVLLVPGGPTVAELADLGAARISVGAVFGYVALAAVADAARQFRDGGPIDYWPAVRAGREVAGDAFPATS